MQRSGVGSSVFRCFFFHGEKLGETVWGRFHQFHGGVFLFGLGGGEGRKGEPKKGEGVILSTPEVGGEGTDLLEDFGGCCHFCGENPEAKFPKSRKIPKATDREVSPIIGPRGVDPCLSTSSSP